jgi:hypothetical protein
VYDQEATIFAACLYRHLAGGEDLALALAFARRELANDVQLPKPATSPVRQLIYGLPLSNTRLRPLLSTT